jgi:LmbE family N-acetylglucosaminyl deacetylase
MIRRRWARAAWAALVVMCLAGLLGSSPYADLALILLTELEELDVGAYERLLVLAPHADDEVIGASGLLMAAREAGLEVRVVVATNGDGYLNAAMRGAGLLPTSRGFRQLGGLRQQESMAAMHLLSLPPETLTFLSYPDRGLASLWTTYWSNDRPFRSPYIRADHSPYLLTYNPDAWYSGDFLLGDLITLLRDHRPDLLAIPHPADEHPDHWALAAFARLALAYVEAEDPAYRPDVLGYLVHAGQYPFPAASTREPPNLLLPPPAFSEIGAGWKAVSLTEEGITRKAMAIRAHRSQRSTLGAFLDGFARGTELYAVIERPLPLRTIAEGGPFRPTTWLDADGTQIGPVLLDPVRDQTMRRRVPSADLAAMHAARWEDDTLVVCNRVRGHRTRALSYLLRVVAIGTDGVAHYSARSGYNQLDPEFSLSDTNMICDQVPLNDLGDPWLVALSAEARLPGGSALDTTAWQFILLEPATAPLLDPEVVAVGGEPAPLPVPEPGDH